MLLLGQKKLLLLEKSKTQFHDEKEKFDEKEFQKTNQKEFRIEKVIKRKGNKLYVKCKSYDNSIHSWIIKKTLFKNESILS